MNVRSALSLVAVLAAAAGALGCGGDEQPYPSKPAVSGKKAALPAVPTLPTKVKKQGDAYTVWGVTHDLRSRVHNEEVNGKKISIVGYIVKANYDLAPKCAIHKTGKGDTPDCKAPIPTFSIADEKGEVKDMIDVMGWASNYAQIFTLIETSGPAQGNAQGLFVHLAALSGDCAKSGYGCTWPWSPAPPPGCCRSPWGWPHGPFTASRPARPRCSTSG